MKNSPVKSLSGIFSFPRGCISLGRINPYTGRKIYSQYVESHKPFGLPWKMPQETQKKVGVFTGILGQILTMLKGLNYSSSYHKYLKKQLRKNKKVPA